MRVSHVQIVLNRSRHPRIYERTHNSTTSNISLSRDSTPVNNFMTEDVSHVKLGDFTSFVLTWKTVCMMPTPVCPSVPASWMLDWDISEPFQCQWNKTSWNGYRSRRYQLTAINIMGLTQLTRLWIVQRLIWLDLEKGRGEGCHHPGIK